MFFMMSVLVSANIDIIFEKQSSSCIKKDRETVRPETSETAATHCKMQGVAGYEEAKMPVKWGFAYLKKNAYLCAVFRERTLRFLGVTTQQIRCSSLLPPM